MYIKINNPIQSGLSWFALFILVAFPVNAQTSIKRLKFQAENFWQQGKFHRAIEIWQQQSQVYKEQKKLNQEAEVNLKIAQGYIKLGNYDLAIDKLNYILSLELENSNLKASTWEKLGNTLSGSGKYHQAIIAYQRSLKLKQSLSSTNNLVKTWKSLIHQTEIYLGEVEKEEIAKQYKAQLTKYRSQAFKYAQLALDLSETDQSLSTVYALINWVSLSQKPLSPDQIAHASRILSSQPPSRSLVFSLINWSKVDLDQELSWLLKALNIAQLTSDALAMSYANLELAYFSEKTGALEQALEYSKKTQLLAQGEFVYDSLFRSQWLTGRIYHQLNRRTASLTAYQNAIATLDTINQDLSFWNSRQSLDFEAHIEPVYRELMELLLTGDQVDSKNRRCSKQGYTLGENYLI